MANDFSTDPRVKSLYRFEDGAIAVDSIGGITLTLQNNPVVDLTEPMEGAGCALLSSASAQGFYIPDANLPAGYPLKSGDTVKKIAILGWYKPTTNPAADKVVFAKWPASGSSPLCFLLDHINNVLSFGWAISNNSADWSWGSIVTLNAGTAYHIALLIDGVAKTAKLRIWNGSTVTNYTKTYSSELYIGAGNFWFGCQSGGANPINGRFDEVVILNDLPSDSEIDLVRAGNFNSSYWGTQAGGAGVQAVYFETPSFKAGGAGVQAVYSVDKVTIDSITGLFLYEPTPKVTVEAAQAVVLWGDVSRVWVEQINALVLWSDTLDVQPPDNAISSTRCEAIPAVPDNCLSLTKCEAIPYVPPPDNTLSLTGCEGIELPHPDDCLSLTFCESPSRGAPDGSVSLTFCPDIPFTYGTGTFMIF